MLNKLPNWVVLSLSVAVFVPGYAIADSNIVQWTDEHGVVQFTDAQHAPPGAGEAVALKQANSMDAPDTRILVSGRSAKGPRMVKLGKARKKNPRGWRGYNRVRGHSKY